ncbi:G2/mitotic-specific cyclin-B1-like isoform X2 [Mixophyes fleayi]|uniref:G2/mitotic-specific cyclin-B1-like isoform X2 n=1 Tax=Mixophyes fleayi TaxID=3061075 RepID=UPI003F4E2427
MAGYVARSNMSSSENCMLPSLAGKNSLVSRPELQPRRVLGDIGNRVDKPELSLKEKKSTLQPPERTKKLVVKNEAAPEPKEPVEESVSAMDISSCSQEDGLTLGFSTILISVKDVDADDADNPMLCSDYVTDIYTYLRTLEAEQPIRPHYLKGQEITGKMRAILVDWLVQVHLKFKLLQETMFMTVAIMDQFLQVNPVPKRLLQLVGVTSMFIACKYEELFPPQIYDFAYVTNDSYTTAQIRNMEIQILTVLKYKIGRPLPLHFLRRASKVGETPTLQYYMAYTEDALLPVMQHMAKNVVKVNKRLTVQMSVRNKYASSQYMKISCLSKLISEPILKLANAIS